MRKGGALGYQMMKRNPQKTNPSYGQLGRKIAREISPWPFISKRLYMQPLEWLMGKNFLFVAAAAAAAAADVIWHLI